MTVNDRTVGVMEGQSGVLGINYTATFGKSMMSDRRLMYVNPNHGDATDNGNTGENPEQPFLTVAAALARTRDNRGDVIFVGQNDAWTYGGGSTWQTAIAEEVTITTEGVSIIGTNPGGLGVYWNPVTAAGAGTCITVHAMDVLISGFAFEGGAEGGTGIYALWDGATMFGENMIVRDCYFDSDMDIGIQLNFSWNCEISGCNFQECDSVGIYCDTADSGADYNRIHHNIFHDCGAGGIGAISLQGCSENHIWANSIFNGSAQGGGAATDEGIDTAGGGDNQVFDNYFSCANAGVGAGDYDDLNSASATDAWVANHVMTGLAITNPA